MSNADFPIPYAAQDPEDDLRDAMTLFEVVDALLDRGGLHGMTKDNVSNLSVLFNEAREKLEPVLEYLDQERSDDTTTRYQAARREVIRRSFERRPS